MIDERSLTWRQPTGTRPARHRSCGCTPLARLIAILGILVPSLASAATIANLETRIIFIIDILKAGFLRVQRQANPRVHDYAVVEDVILTVPYLAAEKFGRRPGLC